MTVTTTSHRSTAPATTSRVDVATADVRPALWRPALASGLIAAAATTAIAAALQAMGVPLTVGGEPIPLLGFANLTLMCVAAGFVLAVALRRFARTPHRTFVVSTMALTAVSFVPDLVVEAALSTRVSLIAMHVVAAAIVIPAISSRLTDRNH